MLVLYECRPAVFFTQWCASTLHFLWGNYCEETTIPSSLNPSAIVNSERPCDALIVEVTGISTEYAKPPCKSHQAQWITSSLERIGHLLSRFVNREVRNAFLACRFHITDRKQKLGTVNCKTRQCWQGLMRSGWKVTNWLFFQGGLKSVLTENA